MYAYPGGLTKSLVKLYQRRGYVLFIRDGLVYVSLGLCPICYQDRFTCRGTLHHRVNI